MRMRKRDFLHGLVFGVALFPTVQRGFSGIIAHILDVSHTSPVEAGILVTRRRNRVEEKYIF